MHGRGWLLIDIYLDFHSGMDDNRLELQRLIKDCQDGVIDTILTKSVSRFGRDTATTISLIRKLSAIGVRVIFENEEIDTSKYESEFLITLIEDYAQEEDYNRSENILWGIEIQIFIFYDLISHHFIQKYVVFCDVHTIISVISIAFSLA